MSNSEDNYPAIVVDNGSDTVRAGYAGENAPKTAFPCVTGRPRKCGPQVVERLLQNHYIGYEAQDHWRFVDLRHPVEYGIVTNWDDMEKVRSVCTRQ